MTIRAATIKDIPAIISLVESLSHYYLNDKTQPLPNWFAQSLTKEQFQHRIENDAFSNYVYQIDKTIAGYISLENNSHLYHLFVSEDFHCQGIASMLWQHLIRSHKSQEYWVRSSLFAVPIYKKFGFVESALPQEKDGISYQPMHWQLTT